ncbi:MAG: hypothetical protein PHT88_01755 [Candidatus Moranbacteria bacterium]|nr:hypothetical protein [Candidatus Moranbacteria bacterium]
MTPEAHRKWREDIEKIPISETREILLRHHRRIIPVLKEPIRFTSHAELTQTPEKEHMD